MCRGPGQAQFTGRKGNKSGVGGKEKCDNPRMGMKGNVAKTVLLGVPVGGASLGE